jgi:hypothetical protein
VHQAAVEEAIARLKSLARTFGEQDWSKVDQQVTRRNIRELDARLLRGLARAVPDLAIDVPSGELPDLFGYAITTLASEAFFALVNQRRALFAELFPAYLPGATAAFDRVRLELADSSPETLIVFSADIALELLELSGYAYLDTAIFGGEAWPAVRAAWDSYLADVDAGKVIKLFVTCEKLRSDDFRMSPRETLRFSWSREFSSLTRSRGAQAAEDYGGRRADGPRIEPIDPIAHAFLRRGDFQAHARDVFIATYLLARPEAHEIDGPRGARDLARDSARLREWREEAAATGGGPLGAAWDLA